MTDHLGEGEEAVQGVDVGEKLPRHVECLHRVAFQESGDPLPPLGMVLQQPVNARRRRPEGLAVAGEDLRRVEVEQAAQ